jgi:ATP/maltotriose-dependent transcriptional regulator MalT
VRRAEVARWSGDWSEAEAEAARACEHYARAPGEAGAGEAHYQLGEMRRLREQPDQAEQAFREASRLGRRPQPGLALLRLSQHQVPAAASALRNALDESRSARARSLLLPACVEILLATGDIAGARAAAGELGEIAASLGSPLLGAAADHARGSVHLVAGETRDALVLLRRAETAWRDLEAPYEAARTRTLTALACERQGDRDTAELEFDAARQAMEALDARIEFDRLIGRFGTGGNRGDGLSNRERQVLTLVASGQTNRAIASALSISEKTVARHLSNIFTKLGLTSRAAATAWAYEHGIK